MRQSAKNRQTVAESGRILPNLLINISFLLKTAKAAAVNADNKYKCEGSRETQDGD